jgi:hypothetical protein
MGPRHDVRLLAQIEVLREEVGRLAAGNLDLESRVTTLERPLRETKP